MITHQERGKDLVMMSPTFNAIDLPRCPLHLRLDPRDLLEPHRWRGVAALAHLAALAGQPLAANWSAFAFNS